MARNSSHFLPLPLLLLLLLLLHALHLQFRVTAEKQIKKANHGFSSAPIELPTRKMNLMGSEVNLRQIFVDPVRPALATNSTAVKRKMEKQKKAASLQLGCRLWNRRRRKRQSCFGCGCGNGGCGCPGDGCRRANGCGVANRGACGPGCPQQPLQALPLPLPPVSSPARVPPPPRPPPPPPAAPSSGPGQPFNLLLPSQQLPQLIPGSTLALSSAPNGAISYKIIPPPNQPLQTQSARPIEALQRQGQVAPSEKSSEADQEYSAEEAAAADDLSQAQPPALPSPLKKNYDQVLGQGYPTVQQSRPVPGYAHPLAPPPPPPPPAIYAKAPPPPPPPPKAAYVKPKSAFPLPECYINKDNFMCCNAQLEETMNNAYNSLINSNPNFHRCNVQTISTTVQKFAERRFNTSFESVAGLGDYASKSHFFHNYICKIERDSRYIMAYGTPRWDLEGEFESGEVPPPPPPSIYPVSPNRQFNPRTIHRIWSNYIYQW